MRSKISTTYDQLHMEYGRNTPLQSVNADTRDRSADATPTRIVHGCAEHPHQTLLRGGNAAHKRHHRTAVSPVAVLRNTPGRMMRAALLALLVTVGAASHAAPQYRYDPATGDVIRIERTGPDVSVRGYGTQGGQPWSAQIAPDGLYRGRDAQGNAFSGDARSGFQINHGTGRSCFGTGAARTCN